MRLVAPPKFSHCAWLHSIDLVSMVQNKEHISCANSTLIHCTRITVVQKPSNIYSIRRTNILANLTLRFPSSPSGEFHERRVTLRDRNIQLAQGGANTSTPPGRVFHTWAEGGATGCHKVAVHNGCSLLNCTYYMIIFENIRSQGEYCIWEVFSMGWD